MLKFQNFLSKKNCEIIASKKTHGDSSVKSVPQKKCCVIACKYLTKKKCYKYYLWLKICTLKTHTKNVILKKMNPTKNTWTEKKIHEKKIFLL